MGRNPPFFPVGTQWETRGKNRQQGLGKKGFPQKKVLSLVLCVAMMLSVMVMSTGATSFSDEDEFSPQYKEAAEVLTGMGVIQGYEDGSYFLPQRNITRAQVATMIYRAVTHDVNDTQTGIYKDYNKFKDVPSTDWSAGYVNYCANGEIIKGFTPDTFGPLKNVTGYQVLAMILRAVGYDANDEFTGDGWAIRVATTAQQLGILENVQEATLGQAATRELVAELIFQTMSKVAMVEYTPALGYVKVPDTVNNDRTWLTLGEDEFGLTKNAPTSIDDWGRPGYTWTYDTGDKETVIEQTPLYTYTTTVSECDIAADINLSKTTSLEKAYIDGIDTPTTDKSVTTNQYASINPLATNSYVGAQGRVTEVYDMGDAGLRLVEINTYLAVVDKVTAATTDKNGHTTDATVDLTVYSGNNAGTVTTYDMDKVVASGYSVGDYVLVQISNPGKTNDKVQSIELAPLTVGGKVTSWTNASGDTAATTTVGEKTYKEANKFFLNYRDTQGNWMVATDDYGNVIGLVPTTVNYLVIEQIEWKHSSNTVGGGYALANVVLADGSDASGVTIASVDGTRLNEKTVSDKYANNTSYYDHIFTYSVNSDGSYNIAKHNQDTIADVLNNTGTITNGAATISSQTNKYVATNTTVFLLQNADDYTYTTYVGKDAVPSIANANLCILTDKSGYASLVVAYEYDLASNTFLAYVTDADQDVYNNPNGAGYYVYKLGETTATTVYDNTNKWTAGYTHNTGVYEFTVNADGQITSMSPKVCDLHCTSDYAGFDGLYRAAVKEAVQNGSFQTQGYSSLTVDATKDAGYTFTAGSALVDFNVTNDTTYIVVTKTGTGTDATLAAGTAADVTAGSVVLVDYTVSGNKYTADIVYILKVADDGTNPNPNPSDVQALTGRGTVSVGGNTIATNISSAYKTLEDALENATEVNITYAASQNVTSTSTLEWTAVGVYANDTVAKDASLTTSSATDTVSANIASGTCIVVAYSQNFVNYYVAYIVK